MSLKSSSIKILSKLLRPGLSSRAAAAFLCPLLRASRVRRGVAERNLRRALPGASDSEIRALTDATYDHMIWTGIEFIAMQREPRKVLEWADAEGADILSRAADGGAILLTGHVGNWELTAAWVAQMGWPITAIVRESDDESERGAIDSMREHVGVRCMPKTAPMRRAVSLVKSGEFLGILPDQHESADTNGIMVPYFGIETGTARGPAVFAMLTGRPLIPVFSHRVAPFRHKIRVAPPIEWTAGATKDETIWNITKKVNEVMEAMVLEAPGQWLAAHRRFRELER